MAEMLPIGSRLSRALRDAEMARHAVAVAEEVLAEAKADLVRYQREVIPNLMNEMGVDEFSTHSPTGDAMIKVTLSQDVEVGITRDEKPAAYRWMDDNGFGDLLTRELIVHDRVDDVLAVLAEVDGDVQATVKRDVHHSRFKAWCKEKLAQGVELPEHIFKLTPYTWARITQPKQRGK